MPRDKISMVCHYRTYPNQVADKSVSRISASFANHLIKDNENLNDLFSSPKLNDIIYLFLSSFTVQLPFIIEIKRQRACSCITGVRVLLQTLN